MAHKKTWAEKLQDSKGFPKIIPYSAKLPCGKALAKQGARPGDTVVLVQPLEVREVMSTVPQGKLITLNEICRRLAVKHGADYCCTLTAGIFVMTAANAAEETGDELAYWRTVKNDGELNAKFPGGGDAQAARLEREGFRVSRRGRRWFVEEFERYLDRPDRPGQEP